MGDGDSSSYCNVDNSALAAQDLTSPRGKILRITTSGAGVPSNPFYESGNPASPHFNDQAGRYSTGELREVYFYRDQLQGHTRRTYHPGN